MFKKVVIDQTTHITDREYAKNFLAESNAVLMLRFQLSKVIETTYNIAGWTWIEIEHKSGRYSLQRGHEL